jgi:hypothetical protein
MWYSLDTDFDSYYVKYFKISPGAVFVIVAVPAVFCAECMGMILISYHEKFYMS